MPSYRITGLSPTACGKCWSGWLFWGHRRRREAQYANYQAILRFTRIGHAKILEEGFIPEGAPVADRDIVFGGGGEVALVGEVRLK